MNVFTEDDALKELLETGVTGDKRYRKLKESVISGFLKTVAIMRNANRIEDLFVYNSLHYEKLSGNMKGYESVRCNKRWRLIFKSSPKDGSIIITEICLIEISDHYGDN